MRHASLFSGIGGFDLAADWMGWTNVLQCEKDEFCRKVLNYYWPKTILYDDIKKTDFTIHSGEISILTGGFPCQPFSQAGQRKGTEDDRHLWPEMLRAIREIAPSWVVAENVYGIVNWSEGMVFDKVCADLENEGYKVQPYIIPASAVNAPHRRYRVWFVAHRPERNERQYNRGKKEGQTSELGERVEQGNVTDTECKRQPGSGRPRNTGNTTEKGQGEASWTDNELKWPTQSPVCSRNDGLPSELDGIAFSKWRRESIKGYGNAVVPQAVLQIFKAIEEYKSIL